jgi:hypothetical protein
MTHQADGTGGRAVHAQRPAGRQYTVDATLKCFAAGKHVLHRQVVDLQVAATARRTTQLHLL